MTTRNSFRKRPPFPFSNRARTNQLVCDPRSYVRAWQADGRPLWAPELAWAPGPTTLADTGDGSFGTLYGSAWLTQVCLDGSWALYQRTGDETLTVTAWDVTPNRVPPSVRHHTTAFDQSARPMIAYEGTNGIMLRQFDEFGGQYDITGPYAGVDPVLWTDAAVNGRVPGSDVILSYLSTDRSSLKYRIQSENFAAEHDHYSFTAPVVLDRHDLLMLRYQLKYGLEDGSRDTESDPHALRSLLYPYYAGDESTVAVSNFPVGEYALVVLVETPDADELAAAIANFASADYHSVILLREPDREDLDAAIGNFAAADHPEVVILREPDMEELTAAITNFAAGDNARVVILREPDQDDMTASIGNFATAAYALA